MSESAGGRIAHYRRRRGLSQAALAGLVGRSESWLSQVERGLRAVDRLSVLVELAKVLRVDVGVLTGEPQLPELDGAAVPDAIREYFTRYDALVDLAPRSAKLDSVRRQVAVAHQLYQSADYHRAMAAVPDLLGAVDGMRGSDSLSRQAAVTCRTSAYVVVAKLLTKLGVVDLALLAADRAAQTALESADPVDRGLASYQVACALLRSGRPVEAERVAVRMAEDLTVRAEALDPIRVSVAGALWLIAAVIAAHRAEPDEARDRLVAAQRLADVLDRDGNHAWTAFGGTNVAIHRVAVSVRLGDIAGAFRAARVVDTNSLPAGLVSRRVQIHVDLATVNVHRRRDSDALLHLLEVERTAPQVLRHDPEVASVVRDLLKRQRNASTTALAGLAERNGLLP